MRATIVLDLEVEDDDDAKEMLKNLVGIDARIIKGNVYDPSQKDFLPAGEYKFSRQFVRHIGVVGGARYEVL